jgi:hypothetical protein
MAKEAFKPFDNQKHGKHILELRHGFSIFEQITKPQIAAMGDKDLGGAKFCLGYSLVDKPMLMVAESHKHDFEQYIFFLGGDAADIANSFDAEIEFGLDDKPNKINYPACIHIAPGTMHGPLDIKKVKKPFIFIDIVINNTPSVRPVPKETPARKK